MPRLDVTQGLHKEGQNLLGIRPGLIGGNEIITTCFSALFNLVVMYISTCTAGKLFCSTVLQLQSSVLPLLTLALKCIGQALILDFQAAYRTERAGILLAKLQSIAAHLVVAADMCGIKGMSENLQNCMPMFGSTKQDFPQLHAQTPSSPGPLSSSQWWRCP